jgi:dTDP-glucose pyrophosphorylase
MFNMKCVIPCGGFGTRGKPWTQYICEEIKQALFITNPDKNNLKQVIFKRFPNKHRYFKFIIDNTYKGLDDSILIARKYCINTAATIFRWLNCFNDRNEIKNLILHFKGSILIGETKVSDVTSYGNLIVKNNKIISITQKPKSNNIRSKLVYWGKVIVNHDFWRKFNGSLDTPFLKQKVLILRSKPYGTGNLKDYDIANYDFTFNSKE